MKYGLRGGTRVGGERESLSECFDWVKKEGRGIHRFGDPDTETKHI